MFYLANPCSDEIVKAMGDQVIGLIDQPNQGKVGRINQAHAVGATWCADNGAFADRWNAETWWAFLEARVKWVDSCLFAVAPDVVGDAGATRVASAPWLDRIADLGYPVAYVAQDGIEMYEPPWEFFDVLFVGGSDEFKLGPVARKYVTLAREHGKRVHMGRVNSLTRLRYARDIGCQTADGTFLKFAPTGNYQRMMRWLYALAVDELI